MSGSCERNNEPSCSLKGGKFLDYMSDYQLLKKDWSICYASYSSWIGL